MTSVVEDVVDGSGPIGKILGGLGGLGSLPGPIGTVLGAVGGAQGLLKKPKAPGQVMPAQAAPFKPIRPGAMSRPESLSEFSNFTPEQERGALATRGVNRGLGRDEDAYYRNLIQRSLIGEDNQPAADTNSLLPIESQYFSRQGINTSGIMDFLRALQGGS